MKKYSVIKTFLQRTEPVSLYNCYVPLDLVRGRDKINMPSLKRILSIGDNIIITGSAGSGKSMLFRHLLIDCTRSKIGVPIFIELRQFNSYDGDLLDLINKNLETFKFTVGRQYVAKALENGHFVVFLDGYDEVVLDKKDLVKTWISEFVKKYDKNKVVITSRHDQELEGWHFFSLLKVSPLSIDQACLLVEKLAFDAEIKGKFLAELKNGLFKKHRSFASNPLLLSIMLLSYGQSATIPDKLSIFYNQAYEALFERHDALKDGFKRKLRSALDIHEFARVFSAFCIQTYDASKFEFTAMEALDYIETSQNIIGISSKKESYLNDLIQAVCLLIQDGLQIVFAHRSFQEYFAARFICDSNLRVQKDLIEKYAERSRQDILIRMLFEMRPDLVEEYYLVPKLTEIIKKVGLKKTVGKIHSRRLVRLCLDRIRSADTKEGAISSMFLPTSDGPYILDMISFILENYSKVVGLNEQETRKMLRFAPSPIGKSAESTQSVDLQKKSPMAEEFFKSSATIDNVFSIRSIRIYQDILNHILNKVSKRERTLSAILRPKTQTEGNS